METDNWDELIDDSLPATSAFIGPGQEAFHLGEFQLSRAGLHEEHDAAATAMQSLSIYGDLQSHAGASMGPVPSTAMQHAPHQQLQHREQQQPYQKGGYDRSRMDSDQELTSSQFHPQAHANSSQWEVTSTPDRWRNVGHAAPNERPNHTSGLGYATQPGMPHAASPHRPATAARPMQHMDMGMPQHPMQHPRPQSSPPMQPRRAWESPSHAMDHAAHAEAAMHTFSPAATLQQHNIRMHEGVEYLHTSLGPAPGSFPHGGLHGGPHGGPHGEPHGEPHKGPHGEPQPARPDSSYRDQQGVPPATSTAHQLHGHEAIQDQQFHEVYVHQDGQQAGRPGTYGSEEPTWYAGQQLRGPAKFGGRPADLPAASHGAQQPDRQAASGSQEPALHGPHGGQQSAMHAPHGGQQSGLHAPHGGQQSAMHAPHGGQQSAMHAPQGGQQPRGYGGQQPDGPSAYRGQENFPGTATYAGPQAAGAPATYRGPRQPDGPSAYRGQENFAGPTTYAGPQGTYGGQENFAGPTTYAGPQAAAPPATFKGSQQPDAAAAYEGGEAPLPAPKRGRRGGRRTTDGGAPQADGLAAPEDAAATVEKCRSVIMQLERTNGELQRRVGVLQEELQVAQRRLAEAEERGNDWKEKLAEADVKVRQRDQQVQDMQQHADAAVTALRNTQQELQRERDRVAAGRDEVARLQDERLELSRELEGAARKIDALGKDDRQLQAELMQLRKEHQEMQGFVSRSKVDLAEMRQRLAQSESEVGRQQQHAAHALAEGGGAVAQLLAAQSKAADLEARNRQLAAELASSRGEGNRGRMQAMQPGRGRGAQGPAKSLLDVLNRGANQAMYPGSFPHEPYSSSQAAQGPPAPANRTPGHNASNPAGIPGSRGESMKSLLYSSTAEVPSGGRQQQQQYRGYDLLDPEHRQSSPQDKGHYMGGIVAGDRAANSWVPEQHSNSAADSNRLSAPSNRQGYFAGPEHNNSAADSNRVSGPSNRQGYLAGPEHSRSPVGGRDVYDRQASASPGPPLGSYFGEPPQGSYMGIEKASADYRRRSIEERLSALQASEEAIRARLAAVGQPRLDAAPSFEREPTSYPVHTSTNRELGGRDPGYARLAPSAMEQYPGAVPWSSTMEQYQSHGEPIGLPASAASPGGQAQAAHGKDLPFGTEITAKEMLARCKHLDDTLVSLCWEKAQLEAELSKLPAGSGRNQKERGRKAEVERRLELLNGQISGARMQLKKLNGMK